MAAQELTATNFEELTGDGIALVDFWADWCGPCHRFSPVFEDVAGKHEDDGVVFGKIDIDAEPELAQRFGVQSIPTLMVVRDGVILVTTVEAIKNHSEVVVYDCRDLISGDRPNENSKNPERFRASARKSASSSATNAGDCS